MSNNDVKRSWADQVEQDDNEFSTQKNDKKGSNEDISHRKKLRKNSDSKPSPKPQRKPLELETNLIVLQRRQKQIDYGKNTVGYHNYIQQVPLDQRTKDHPKTPEKYTKYSRRSWDTLVKMWRKKLHEYDPNGKNEGSDSDNSEKHEKSSD